MTFALLPFLRRMVRTLDLGIMMDAIAKDVADERRDDAHNHGCSANAHEG